MGEDGNVLQDTFGRTEVSDSLPFGLDPDSRELWWLTQTEPSDLLELIEPRGCGRKWWLLVAACLHGIEHKMPGPAALSALWLIEKCAEGCPHYAQMGAAVNEIVTELSGGHPPAERFAGHAALWAVRNGGLGALYRLTVTVAANTASALHGGKHDYTEVVRWLRDIFGDPFRPISFSPEWRPGTAMSLAAQMYESRDFSAMPILADALQDAGCNDADILSHCRDTPLSHVRGCWVVDLVLGKQ